MPRAVRDMPGSVDAFARAMRGDMAEMRADIREIKDGIGTLEGGDASVSRRVDRLGGDVELIKTRFGLIDASRVAEKPRQGLPPLTRLGLEAQTPIVK